MRPKEEFSRGGDGTRAARLALQAGAPFPSCQRRPPLTPQPPTSSVLNFHQFYQPPTVRTTKRRSAQRLCSRGVGGYHSFFGSCFLSSWIARSSTWTRSSLVKGEIKDSPFGVAGPNQSRCPQCGQGASPGGRDGSICRPLPQTGQRFGSPSGVRVDGSMIQFGQRCSSGHGVRKAGKSAPFTTIHGRCRFRYGYQDAKADPSFRQWARNDG